MWILVYWKTIIYASIFSKYEKLFYMNVACINIHVCFANNTQLSHSECLTGAQAKPSKTSFAALWPACTAPFMKPRHSVAVSVPAQWTLTKDDTITSLVISSLCRLRAYINSWKTWHKYEIIYSTFFHSFPMELKHQV